MVWLRRFSPRGISLAVTVLALSATLIGFATAAYFATFGLEEINGGFAGRFAASSSMCAFPFLVLGLGLAALLERRPLARAALLTATTLAVSVGGATLTTGLSLDADLSLGLFAGLLCGLIPAMGTGALAVFFGVHGWQELQTGQDPESRQRVLELLKLRGFVTTTTVARELDVSEEVALTLCRALPESHMQGEFDEPSGALILADRLREAESTLPAVVAAHGELSLTELARTLGVPEGRLPGLIYAAIADDALHGGYVNWQRGLIRSTPEATGAGAGCPNCGGALTPVGKGTLECTHCGSEVFV